MSVEHVEVIVEEPSAEAALRIILPKVLGDTSFAVYQHSCKDELLKRLPERFKGYAARCKKDPWFRQHCRVVVLVDRDQDDCRKLKSQLEGVAKSTGLVTRAAMPNYTVVTRLAIEELEAWYFGDWEAVRRAYPRVDRNVPQQVKFRNPDAITGGTWEAFERVLQKAGYCKTGLRKIETARAIAKHMEPNRNRSPSFQALRSVLSEMVFPQ